MPPADRVQEPEYHITRMSHTDLPAIFALEKEIFPDPWPQQAFVDLLESSISRTFVLRTHSGKPVGYAAYYFIIDEAHISTIAVQPALQGKKLGERLLCAMLASALASDGQLATLEVRASNLVAQNLYRKYQFVVVGERRRYYPNGEDALLMTTQPIPNVNFPELQEYLA